MVERTARLAELLKDAILMAEERPEPDLLTHLREAQSRLRVADEASAPVLVQLVSGRVFLQGLPIALRPRELALVIALALHERGVHRDILKEDLYPELDGHSAVNALKVLVHRVRRRIGCMDVIRFDAGTYRFGDTVAVDLPFIENRLRRFSVANGIEADERDEIVRLRNRLLDGRPAFVLEWEWFDDVERRLRDMARDVGVILGYDALRREQYQRAIDLATELAREDPLDEVATEIAIKGLMLAGNRTAALLEYRRFMSVLRREGAPEPSREIRDLFDERLATAQGGLSSDHSVQP